MNELDHNLFSQLTPEPLSVVEKRRADARIDGIDKRLDEILVPSNVEMSTKERVQLAIHELDILVDGLTAETKKLDEEKLQDRGTDEVLLYAIDRREALVHLLETKYSEQ